MKEPKKYAPIPVLLARENPKDSDIWLCWCAYCLHDHSHGAGAGHRTAHCLAGPFRERGYFVALPGSAFLKKLQRKREVVMCTGTEVHFRNGTVERGR